MQVFTIRCEYSTWAGCSEKFSTFIFGHVVALRSNSSNHSRQTLEVCLLTKSMAVRNTCFYSVNNTVVKARSYHNIKQSNQSNQSRRHVIVYSMMMTFISREENRKIIISFQIIQKVSTFSINQTSKNTNRIYLFSDRGSPHC